MKPFAQTWLSLGSNLGDRLDNLLAGAAFLLSHGLEWKNCSGVYETEPVGYTAQPDFLNMVIHGETRLSPLDLLEVCQQAEKALLRERTIRWGPRTLDVDILLIDDLVLDLPALTLPHPRMAERAFVLGPLGEMDPGLMEKWALPHITEGIRLRMPASDFRDRLSPKFI
ncbi:MAG: 2-amino-4-hydroxy-6-hydroxymethyldihydropteridine diphosphokinase [Clostridiales bacterium]|nr:2-amino-4-hydroxy-6-hydroxymethyldihydropteridine diphosphokinase [Clostridiales bacterium]